MEHTREENNANYHEDINNKKHEHLRKKIKIEEEEYVMREFEEIKRKEEQEMYNNYIQNEEDAIGREYIELREKRAEFGEYLNITANNTNKHIEEDMYNVKMREELEKESPSNKSAEEISELMEDSMNNEDTEDETNLIMRQERERYQNEKEMEIHYRTMEVVHEKVVKNEFEGLDKNTTQSIIIEIRRIIKNDIERENETRRIENMDEVSLYEEYSLYSPMSSAYDHDNTFNNTLNELRRMMNEMGESMTMIRDNMRQLEGIRREVKNLLRAPTWNEERNEEPYEEENRRNT